MIQRILFIGTLLLCLGVSWSFQAIQHHRQATIGCRHTTITTKNGPSTSNLHLDGRRRLDPSRLLIASPSRTASSLFVNPGRGAGFPLCAKNANEGDERTEKKRSLLYRIYRVSTYPVRKVYRSIFPKKDGEQTEEEEEETIAEEWEEIKELVEDAIEEELEEIKEFKGKLDEELEDLKEKIDEKVTSISKNIESTLKSTTPPSLPSWPTKKSPTAPKGVDLSGEWDLIVTDEFKEEYDRYLTLLGQPFFVRSIALSIVALTNEKTVQQDDGASLFVRGQNLRGAWERTLVCNDDKPAEIVTADGETVACDAWWEGKNHHSWLRGVQKYGGGSFESLRYLDPNDNNILVCESTFYPQDESREKARVTWRFQRKSS